MWNYHDSAVQNWRQLVVVGQHGQGQRGEGLQPYGRVVGGQDWTEAVPERNLRSESGVVVVLVSVEAGA
ncbi:hypothetical protein PF011_g33050 [Phytophthora fragariae]|uniref:Uncharacterized protein n=1 Tax=Phytophthora fragariae TaxID=53985 RepID=A0A6A3G273_9STRA|nr:hypothetical protein PF011_g33050 [Phytophthora fragariae]